MKPIIGETTIKVNAVKTAKHFDHFGIQPFTANIYGHTADDIVEVTLKVSTNQVVPESNKKYTDADYWGWWDFKNGEWSLSSHMIYSQYFLLNMCFPAGIRESENVGQGKAYRLEYEYSEAIL